MGKKTTFSIGRGDGLLPSESIKSAGESRKQCRIYDSSIISRDYKQAYDSAMLVAEWQKYIYPVQAVKWARKALSAAELIRGKGGVQRECTALAWLLEPVLESKDWDALINISKKLLEKIKVSKDLGNDIDHSMIFKTYIHLGLANLSLYEENEGKQHRNTYLNHALNYFTRAKPTNAFEMDSKKINLAICSEYGGDIEAAFKSFKEIASERPDEEVVVNLVRVLENKPSRVLKDIIEAEKVFSLSNLSISKDGLNM